MSEGRQGTVLEARAVHKSYRQGPREVRVLEGVELALGTGESLAIVGASGAGKSTLLHILGGLDEPDQGVPDSLLAETDVLLWWGLRERKPGWTARRRLCAMELTVSWFSPGMSV